MGLFSGGLSPEGTLKQAFKALKSEGIEGVKKYLTANALKNLNNIQAWTDYPLFDILTSAVSGSSKDALIKEKIAECDWSIVDVLKGKEEDFSWKIDSLNSPKID